MSLDLETLRAEREAARREQNKEAPTFTLGGKTFTLPAELPLDVAWKLEEGVRGREFARLLLGEAQLEEFIAAGPSRDDYIALDKWFAELYLSKQETTTAGESLASDAS